MKPLTLPQAKTVWRRNPESISLISSFGTINKIRFSQDTKTIRCRSHYVYTSGKQGKCIPNFALGNHWTKPLPITPEEIIQTAQDILRRKKLEAFE